MCIRDRALQIDHAVLRDHIVAAGAGVGADGAGSQSGDDAALDRAVLARDGRGHADEALAALGKVCAQNKVQLTACTGCAAAQAAFAANRPDLMILDINLPDGDGFSLFRALRAKADVPALFLSARDADADRLFGLGLGADDYLTKPFLMQELLLRVQHILQRAYRAELSRTKPAPLQLGERCVDLNDAIVTLPEGKTLALTATELALLRKLAENRGHIVTYDALCAAVWGADYYGYENSLGVHIRHLREKLEAEPGAPQFLRTVRGIGYKLTKGEEA